MSVDPIVSWVADGAFERVALQFPDEMLGESVTVVSSLGERLPNVSWFVLADNTFGSCCPDEVTADHYNAQCIVHFGGACLSKSAKLPIFYVEEVEDSVEIKQDLDAAVQAAEEFFARTTLKTQLLMMVPFGTTQLACEMIPSSTDYCQFVLCSTKANESSSSSFESNWVINRTPVPRLSQEEMKNTVQRVLLVAPNPSSSVVLPQLFLLEKYLLSHSEAQQKLAEEGVPFFVNSELVSNPATRIVDTRLRQRMFNIETVKAARSIGIIVMTLSIAGFRETAELVKKLIRKHSNKRVYMIYIGHLNEFKVANFADTVDCFVVIACPNSTISHFPQKHDNFMKPLIAPVEVLIAMGACDFTSPHAFTTEFSVIRTLASSFLDGTPDGADGAEGKDNTSLIALRHDGTVAAHASAGALMQLHEKTYVGLQARIGETAVQETIETGRSGIARGYATERSNQQES